MQPSITITISLDVRLTWILQWIESNYNIKIHLYLIKFVMLLFINTIKNL